MSFIYCQNPECGVYLGSLGGDQCSICGWSSGSTESSYAAPPTQAQAQELPDERAALSRAEIDAIMTEHYPLDSLLRENVDVFEACVRDIESTINKRRAALAATQERKPMTEWQPIETAPKDGSLFICWVSAIRYGETDEGQQYQEDVSQVDFCNWRTQADIPDCGWFDPCCGQIGDQQGITHWMPLPPPPVHHGISEVQG